MQTGNLALDRQLARWYPLKDHQTQLELVGAVHNGTRFPLVPAGRRCLEAGTLVATPYGPKSIESLSIGDEVIGFNGDKAEVTTVTEVHYNGVQEVIPLLSRDTEYLAATSNHKLWARHSSKGKFSRIKVSSFLSTTRVKRAGYNSDLLLKAGNPRISHTYDITVGNETNLYVLHHGGIVTSNSGKTERFKRFVVKECNRVVGQYFAAAPTHDQAKKIFWNDLKEFSLSITHKRRPSESDRIIYFDNGSELHVIGLDKPQRIEGIPWKGGGIDEFADIKPGAWEANIYPALSTVNPLAPEYRAWCWLLGVPDGLNHYYDLCQIAEAGDPDFKVFHWKSADILPQDVIDAAKRSMGVKQYRQEYEACHLPETEVILFSGEIKKIKDVSIGDTLCHVRDDGKIAACNVEAVGETGVKTITDAILETGECVTASSRHKFKVHYEIEAS